VPRGFSTSAAANSRQCPSFALRFAAHATDTFLHAGSPHAPASSGPGTAATSPGIEDDLEKPTARSSVGQLVEQDLRSDSPGDRQRRPPCRSYLLQHPGDTWHASHALPRFGLVQYGLLVSLGAGSPRGRGTSLRRSPLRSRRTLPPLWPDPVRR